MDKRTKHRTFKNWLFGLPTEQFEPTKQEICDKCYKSRQVINAWIAGRTEIPDIALPVINGIAGKEIFKI